MKILYSPVGDTDPVREYRDGAVLHIMRSYKPDKVVLFLTAEMCRKEKERNLFSKAVNFLQPDCDLELRLHDTQNPHKMDELLPLLEDFAELYKSYPEAEFILNLSSGTPQMKSIMSFIATDFERVTAVQVSSPAHGSNRRHMAAQDVDDVDILLETNEDNDDFINRAFEPPLWLLRRYSVRHQLISLVNNYEYDGALALLKKNFGMFKKESHKLVEHAVLREKLQTKAALEVYTNHNGHSLKLNAGKEIDELNEFLMIMELRQRNNKLAEFIIKLTPLLYRLSLFYLEKQVNIQAAQFCVNKSKSMQKPHWQIDLGLMQQNLGSLYNSFMQANYNFRNYTDLSFTNILLILQALPSTQVNTEIVNEFQELREVEKKLRNSVAHEVIDINEDYVRSVVGKSSYEILQLLRKVFYNIMSNKNVRKSNIYDEINRYIISSLDGFGAGRA